MKRAEAGSALVEARPDVGQHIREAEEVMISTVVLGEGKPIPTNDIWIAAQTIENGADLLSSDPHFGYVENLSWLSFPAR